jgi:hypothetical protein
MKKLIICISCALLSPIIFLKVFAQANEKHSFSLNFGPEVFIPETDFWETHKVAIGGSIKAEYTFGKHASATFNTGIVNFSGKSNLGNFLTPTPSTNASLLAIPLKMGARYYIGNFYFLGEAGIVLVSNFTNTTKTAFSVGLGDKIKIGNRKLDASLRQEIWIGNKERYNMAVGRIAYEIVW